MCVGCRHCNSLVIFCCCHVCICYYSALCYTSWSCMRKTSLAAASRFSLSATCLLKFVRPYVAHCAKSPHKPAQCGHAQPASTWVTGTSVLFVSSADVPPAHPCLAMQLAHTTLRQPAWIRPHITRFDGKQDVMFRRLRDRPQE
jgi:hypothetical protein